jgi:hypothetical protein
MKTFFGLVLLVGTLSTIPTSTLALTMGKEQWREGGTFGSRLVLLFLCLAAAVLLFGGSWTAATFAHL